MRDCIHLLIVVWWCVARTISCARVIMHVCDVALNALAYLNLNITKLVA